MKNNLKEKIFEKYKIVDQHGTTLLTPFVISKERKVIFFHIGKTGGSSIYNLLQKNNLDDCVLSDKKLNYNRKVEYFLDISDNWDEYYKFTFVRNKYDQLISLYHMSKPLLNGISFEKFIKEHVCRNSIFYPNYDYWIDQYFLTTIDDKPIFDFIGKFENYEHDLRYVCHQINIEYEDIRVNIGNYKKTGMGTYYNDKLKQLVNQKFESEMKYYNWKLENSGCQEKLRNEIESFYSLWEGGTTLSKFGWEACLEPRLKNGVDLKKIEEICITPFIHEESTILEIGTNGGAWLKRMMKAKKLIGTDVLGPEHTRFYKNLPKNDNIKYIQVKDFSCDELDDDSITYLFSYDVFCHISYSGTEEYLKNLHSKLKKGAECFIMIADPDKYQDSSGRQKLMRIADFNTWSDFVEDYDGPANKGRWYFYGIERFCFLLNKYHYKIISKDVIGEYDKNSPIVHFKK